MKKSINVTSKRLVSRIVQAFARWGIIPHPYGRDYAEKHFSWTGKYKRLPNTKK